MKTTRVMLLCAAATTLAGRAQAEQFVLFDTGIYTHTNANDSHHDVDPPLLKQPANWTSPVNYAQGTIHFYQEVMTKPSDKPTIIDFCLISTSDYGCIETFPYQYPGLNETVRSMAGKDVDKRDKIDFTRAMQKIQMVLKTPGPTYINGGKPQSDFLPSKMRFVATLVSPGGTYVPPTPTPGFDPGDAGVRTPIDAGVTPDAATPVDAPAADAPAVASSLPDAATAPPATPLPDAAVPPAETPPTPVLIPPPPGGCSVGGGGTGGLLLAAFALLRRRRR